MPYVTFLERYAKGQAEKEGRIAGRLEAIEAVLEVRFPDSSADLMPLIQRVGNLDNLYELLETAKTASLTDIESAIRSAVPPPK